MEIQELLGGGIGAAIFVSIASAVGYIFRESIINKLNSELRRVEQSQVARNESRIHINKIQFENEVKYTTEVWEMACLLDNSALLFKGLRNLNLATEKLSLLDRLLDEFGTNTYNLKRSLYRSVPFIDKAIYGEISNYLTLMAKFSEPCAKEKSFLQNKKQEMFNSNIKTKGKSNDWNNQSFDNMTNKLMKDSTNNIASIAELIRKRFGDMIVIE